MPFNYLFNLASALDLAYWNIVSIISIFINALENFSVTLNFSSSVPPKSVTLVVKFSLVYESNVGLLIKQLTNIHKDYLI